MLILLSVSKKRIGSFLPTDDVIRATVVSGYPATAFIGGAITTATKILYTKTGGIFMRNAQWLPYVRVSYSSAQLFVGGASLVGVTKIISTPSWIFQQSRSPAKAFGTVPAKIDIFIRGILAPAFQTVPAKLNFFIRGILAPAFQTAPAQLNFFVRGSSAPAFKTAPAS